MGVSSAENIYFQAQYPWEDPKGYADYLHAPKQLGVWLPGDRRQMAFPKYYLVTHTKAFTGTCTKKISVLISGIPWAWWELVGVWMCMSVPSSALLALLGLRAASKELWQHTQKHTHSTFLTEKLRRNTIWFYCLFEFPFLIQAIFSFGGVCMFGPCCCPSLLDFIPGEHWHRQELVLSLKIWWTQTHGTTPPSSGKWFTSNWEKFVQTRITSDPIFWRIVSEVSKYSSCNRDEL